MRGPFLGELTELATRDRRIVLLTGDLGYTAIEQFAEKHPERFINVGVAEQNMVGVATGLAEAGFLPFVYSIATFATLRPYEFLRNGPILHRLPVRLVGIGGGLEYGRNGPTHYGLEDLAVLRIQPGITVIAPADAGQAVKALRETWELPGPVYYRLGKDDRGMVPGLDGRFSAGGVDWLCRGGQALMVAAGAVAVEAERARALLAERQIPCGLAVVSLLSRGVERAVAEALSGYHHVVSVEAHYVDGGLGSLVAEVIAESALRCRLTRCGVRQHLEGRTGSLDYLHEVHGLSPDALARTVERLLRPPSAVAGNAP